MFAREQGTSAVGSVPKTKINTEKSKTPGCPKRRVSSRHNKWHKSWSLREISRQMKEGEVVHPWMQSEYLDKNSCTCGLVLTRSRALPAATSQSGDSSTITSDILSTMLPS